MSVREIYWKVNPETMGRDKFVAFCYSLGLKVSRTRNFRRTTDSSGVERFPNLIEGREVTGVHRVLVSDITFYELNGRFKYLTFIMDLYSREIVGYSKGSNLRATSTTIPAINMAKKRIGAGNLVGAIFHSDGGGQYYAKDFIKITSSLGMKNSMAKGVYENSHSERLNGTIKNDYIIPYNPQNDADLDTDLARAVLMYNTDRPHSSLGGKTPVEFRRDNPGNPMTIKKIITTIEVENNSPSYFPTSTVQNHHQCV